MSNNEIYQLMFADVGEGRRGTNNKFNSFLHTFLNVFEAK
jgi:hypothetical protein